jgi:hypothetical protein
MDTSMPRRSLGWAGIYRDREVRVAGIGQQLGEDVVAFDLGDSQQLWAVAAVQFVEYGREVGAFGSVDLLGPAVGLGELEVLGDGVVVGVEQVLQAPPDRAASLLIDGDLLMRQYLTGPDRDDRCRSGGQRAQGWPGAA